MESKTIYIVGDKDYLMHHGIKGQKWGIRRFQNEDGSLTPEGRERYNQYKNQGMSHEQAMKKVLSSKDYSEQKKKDNFKKYGQYYNTKYDEFNHKKFYKNYYKEIINFANKHSSIKKIGKQLDNAIDNYEKSPDQFYKTYNQYNNEIHKVINGLIGELSSEELSKLPYEDNSRYGFIQSAIYNSLRDSYSKKIYEIY